MEPPPLTIKESFGVTPSLWKAGRFYMACRLTRHFTCAIAGKRWHIVMNAFFSDKAWLRFELCPPEHSCIEFPSSNVPASRYDGYRKRFFYSYTEGLPDPSQPPDDHMPGRVPMQFLNCFKCTPASLWTDLTMGILRRNATLCIECCAPHLDFGSATLLNERPRYASQI